MTKDKELSYQAARVNDNQAPLWGLIRRRCGQMILLGTRPGTQSEGGPGDGTGLGERGGRGFR